MSSIEKLKEQRKLITQEINDIKFAENRKLNRDKEKLRENEEKINRIRDRNIFLRFSHGETQTQISKDLKLSKARISAIVAKELRMFPRRNTKEENQYLIECCKAINKKLTH